jgi:hypothetical protein
MGAKLILKGIMDVEDARLAVDAGADAIVADIAHIGASATRNRPLRQHLARIEIEYPDAPWDPWVYPAPCANHGQLQTAASHRDWGIGRARPRRSAQIPFW